MANRNVGFSLSQACQYYAPENKKSSKKARITKDNDDNDDDWDKRKYVFFECWKEVDKYFDKVQKDLYSELINKLCKFINDKLKQIKSDQIFCSLIPTALVTLGMIYFIILIE